MATSALYRLLSQSRSLPLRADALSLKLAVVLPAPGEKGAVFQRGSDGAAGLGFVFAVNYASKEEIFISELKELVARYEAEGSATKKQGIYYDRQHMTHCFHYFYAHRAFMDGLIYCGFGDVFLRLITEYVQQKWSDDPSNIEQAYQLAAFSGMLYNVYSAWVQLDCVQPPEEVAEIVERMCNMGFGA